jgi:hypothetical protein
MLVDRQAGVYLLRPAMYTPREVIYLGEPLMFEEMGHLQTTTAMVTDHNDVDILIKFGSACRHGSHRHVLGRFDAADLPFPRLTDIEKKWTTARCIVEPCFKLASRNICHRG